MHFCALLLLPPLAPHMSFVLAEDQCGVWLLCEARHCTMGLQLPHLLLSVQAKQEQGLSTFYSVHYPTYYTPFIQLDGYLNPGRL